MEIAKVRSAIDSVVRDDMERLKWDHALGAARCLRDDDPRLKEK